ncbi:MAG TPA: sigma-70 family RNA polymerase sigma factor [Solirubrobacterales bacterium]|nr:sigma-70 family RNA polymerase sigma factor [Solirubrobacterales bacterium]
MTSDASLILRARGGDESAWYELTKRYENFIGFVACLYFIPGGERADVIQEGFHGLVKAVQDYRPDRESGFRNFAETCIRRQIITAVKAATRKKHGPLNEYLSFATPAFPTGDESEVDMAEALPAPPDHDPCERLCERGDLETLGEGLETLTKLERSVCLRLADGLSYKDVARQLGVSLKMVDNATQRAKRKLGLAMMEPPSPQPAPAAVEEVRMEESSLEPTTSERIEAFLWQSPGSTPKEIAEGLGLKYHCVLYNLNRGWPGLTKARTKGSGRRSYRWYMFRRERAAA